MAKREALLTIFIAALVLLSAGTLSCARPAERAQLTALPHGTCSISGSVISIHDSRPVEGAQLTVHVDVYGDDAKSIWSGRVCQTKPMLMLRTDRMGYYYMHDLPILPRNQALHIRVDSPENCPEERVVFPSAFQNFTLDFQVGECVAYVVVVGNPPFIDRSNCGSGVIVTADPRTGEPVPNPY